MHASVCSCVSMGKCLSDYLCRPVYVCMYVCMYVVYMSACLSVCMTLTLAWTVRCCFIPLSG
jgi:hypothetical protein